MGETTGVLSEAVDNLFDAVAWKNSAPGAAIFFFVVASLECLKFSKME